MKVLTIQKLMGAGLIILAATATLIIKDCTVLVFSLFFAIPLIFSNQNLIGIVEEDDYIESEDEQE